MWYQLLNQEGVSKGERKEMDDNRLFNPQNKCLLCAMSRACRVNAIQRGRKTFLGSNNNNNNRICVARVCQMIPLHALFVVCCCCLFVYYQDIDISQCS